MFIIRDYSRIVDRKPVIIRSINRDVVLDFIDGASFEGDGSYGRIWMTPKHEYHVTATRADERAVIESLA